MRGNPFISGITRSVGLKMRWRSRWSGRFSASARQLEVVIFCDADDVAIPCFLVLRGKEGVARVAAVQ